MRYPTRHGLVIPPYELGFTVPSEEQISSRVTTNHHGYFDKDWYHDRRYRQVFRNLVTHVYPMLATEHNTGEYTLHDQYSAPVMPRDIQMIDVVEDYLATHGVINCVKEKKTNQVYQITGFQWENIRSEYRGVA